jgi:hypothetical protein
MRPCLPLIALGPLLLFGACAIWSVRGATAQPTVTRNGVVVPDAARRGAFVNNEVLASPYRGMHFVAGPSRSDLAPGMYRVVDSADRGIGEQTSYVPPAPDRPPALRIGQRFLASPAFYGFARGAFGFGARETPTAWRSRALHEYTLTHIERLGEVSSLTFAGTEKFVARVARDTEVTQIDGLRPVLEDDALREVRRLYVGHTAWTLGLNEMKCARYPNRALEIEAAMPVRIEAIYRVPNLTEFRSSGQQNIWSREEARAFWIHDPMLVVLRPLARSSTTSFVPRPTATPLVVADTTALEKAVKVFDGVDRERRAGPLPTPDPSIADPCTIGTNALADRWEVERTFSLRPPDANVRAALHNGRMARLTHDEVAFVMGYPSDYGPRAELDRARKWTYTGLGGYDRGTEISFGRNGLSR